MSLHLQREIDRLKKLFLELCALTEDSLRVAVKSVIDRDGELAQKVIDNDNRIDNMEVDVEEECLKILALHQPVAVDLRFVIAVLKINNDLERIGDLAVNIAEKTLLLKQMNPVEMPFDFEGMATRTQTMLKQSLDALVGFHADVAREVIQSDPEVDAIHRSMYDAVQSEITKSPEQADVYIVLLTLSRAMERIADYATNISEDVLYLIAGEIVRHQQGEDA